MLHGNRTYLLMDDDGQIKDAHSISAGLDYPGIGPEHSWLHDIGRATYLSATDEEALAAFQLISKLEGIIPALGVGPCPCPCRRSRAEAAEGPPHGGEPLGARRQGHPAGGGDPGRDVGAGRDFSLYTPDRPLCHPLNSRPEIGNHELSRQRIAGRVVA